MGLFDAMERLKVRIHSARMPLSRRGQGVMGVVYFSIPIIIGHFSLNWVQNAERENREKWQNEQMEKPPTITFDDINQGLHPAPKK